jgi:hypothetical protein
LITGAKIKEILFILFQAFIILCHSFQAHSHAGKSTIMIDILHSNLPGQIRKKHYAKISTFLSGGVSQRGHSLCEVEQGINAFDSASRRGPGR